jgi:hypothetical protein
MPYKGGDLDVRCLGVAQAHETPEAPERSREPGWGPLPAVGGGPISVDEVVLACCNEAFDVAQFHGAASVRPEHLLHALTRIEAAGAILAELSIRTDMLRRETAVAVAQMTSGGFEGARNPRASAAFADILRRAESAAHARWQPAGVRDVVRALVLAGPDSPAGQLLMRAAIDPARLERWRDEPRREASLSTQLVRSEPQVAPVAPATEALVTSRFDALHAAIQTLREEAAADRRAIGEFMRALQSELATWRGEARQAAEAGRALAAHAAQATLVPAPDRSAAVDAVLEAKLGEFGRAMAALAGRLGVVDRLAAGDPWQALGTRLEAVEGSIADQASRVADAVAAVLSQDRQDEEARHIALQASIRTQAMAAEEANKARERELRLIHDALDRLGSSQRTLGESLGAWQSESSGDVSVLSNRLEQLDRSALDLIDRLGGEVEALRQQLAEEEARRSNGFKRWLYGTSHVFANSWREEAAAIRARFRSGDKS